MFTTYEIPFIHLGFLVSSELWLSYLVCGLIVGFVVIADTVFLPARDRIQRAKFLQEMSLRHCCLLFFVIVALWWYALYLYVQTVAGRLGWR